MSPYLRISIDGPVMVVTMDRPPANAIDTPFSTALYEAFRAFNENEGQIGRAHV